MARSYHNKPCPKDYENHTFDRSFLAHPHFIHSLSALCQGVEKIFIGILVFTHKLLRQPFSMEGLGWWLWNLNFLISTPFKYMSYITNLVVIVQFVFERMFTNMAIYVPVVLLWYVCYFFADDCILNASDEQEMQLEMARFVAARDNSAWPHHKY